MTRDKHKTLTKVALLFLTFAIIFAFSKITFNPNLNANNNDNNNQNNTPAPFTYVNARNSLITNVIYENNFGGSQEEELKTVYNLDYFYLIGNTKSSDYYFNQNNSQRVFVIKITQNGSATNITTTNDKSVYYVSSYLTSFGIYILCQEVNYNNGVVYFYSFSSSTINLVVKLNNFTAFKILKNNNLTLIGIKNSKICAMFYNETTESLTETIVNSTATNLKFVASYKLGAIVFANNNSGFSAYYINENSYELLYFNNNYKLINFQINNFGYFLLLSNETNFSVVFLNANFIITNETTLQLSTDIVFIENISNNIYIIYKNAGNRININIFSSKGDSVFNITLSHIISKVFKLSVFNNNLHLSCLTQENNFKLLILNPLAQVLTDTLIPFNSFGEIVEVEQSHDQHLLFFGKITSNNTVIKNNYGLTDIFVFKLFV